MDTDITVYIPYVVKEALSCLFKEGKKSIVSDSNCYRITATRTTAKKILVNITLR